MTSSFSEVSVSESGTDAGRQVFVIHGRNLKARDAMFEFLRSIDLRPIEWNEAIALTGKAAPYVGEVLDAAFGAATAVVVLMTPDEIAYLRSEYADGDKDRQAEPSAQARPNVLFEAGMAMGRNADRTVLVELGDVRPFSDVAGRHAVRIDNSAERRIDLANRLRSAGCKVNTGGDSWLSAGDFSAPADPGSSLPLGKRVPEVKRPPVALDADYASTGTGKGVIHIVNRGTEAAFGVDLDIPDEPGVSLMTSDLPIDELPAGKSVGVPLLQTMGGGKRHFKVKLTARTADGTDVEQDGFVDLLG